MTKPLSETRKADRKVMADAIESMLKRLQCEYTRLEPADIYPGKHCIMLKIEESELRVTVDFDGDSVQPNVYVLSWHMSYESRKQLNDATFGGSVNPYHKAKAIYVARGFDDLCYQLERGLKMAIDGTAFL